MNCITVVETEAVELDLWTTTATPCAIADTSFVRPSEADEADNDSESYAQEVFQTIPTKEDEDVLLTDENDDSDTEVDFEDASEYINDSSVASDEPVPSRSISTLFRDKSLRGKLCHNLNSILVATTMLIGIIFAYFQYRQQTWSNQLSALQTCLTLEETSSTMANSTFCSETLRKGVQKFRPRLRRHNEPDGNHPKPLYPILLLASVLLNIVFFLQRWYNGTTSRQVVRNVWLTVSEGSFSPSVHVPTGLARLDHGIQGEIPKSLQSTLRMRGHDESDEIPINSVQDATGSLLVQHVYHLHEKLFELRGERDSLVDKKDLLDTKVEELCDKVNVLQAEKEAAQQLTDSIQNEKSKLQEATDQLRNSNVTLSQQIVAVSKERDSLKRKLYTLEFKQTLVEANDRGRQAAVIPHDPWPLSSSSSHSPPRSKRRSEAPPNTPLLQTLANPRQSQVAQMPSPQNPRNRSLNDMDGSRTISHQRATRRILSSKIPLPVGSGSGSGPLSNRQDTPDWVDVYTPPKPRPVDVFDFLAEKTTTQEDQSLPRPPRVSNETNLTQEAYTDMQTYVSRLSPPLSPSAPLPVLQIEDEKYPFDNQLIHRPRVHKVRSLPALYE